MQIETAFINDRLRVSKVSWKFQRIPAIYNFEVTCPWNLLFSEKVAHFLTVSIVFSASKQNLEQQRMRKFLCYFVLFEAIILLLLYNLRDCTFNALNWFAADLQILLTWWLKLSFWSSWPPQSLTEDTVSIVLLQT